MVLRVEIALWSIKKSVSEIRTNDAKTHFDQVVILVMTTILWVCTWFRERPTKLLSIVSDELSG